MAPPTPRQLEALKEIQACLSTGLAKVDAARFRAQIIVCGSTMLTSLGAIGLVYWALSWNSDESSAP